MGQTGRASRSMAKVRNLLVHRHSIPERKPLMLTSPLTLTKHQQLATLARLYRS